MFLEEKITTNKKNENSVSLKLLLNQVVSKYFLANNISLKYSGIVESKVLDSFYNNIDTIQTQYEGKAQYSTYCITVFFRLVRNTVNNDLKLIEPAS